jgi:transcriptional regulator with XRE-family HTH domain
MGKRSLVIIGGGNSLLHLQSSEEKKLETLGDLITEWAQAQKALLTPARLHEILGFTISAITKWLKGSPEPSIETLKQIYWRTREYNETHAPKRYPFGDDVLGIPWQRLAELRPDMVIPNPDFWAWLEQFSTMLPNEEQMIVQNFLSRAQERYEAGEPPIPNHGNKKVKVS